MNRSLSLFAIGLVFGGGIGFTLAAANGVTFNGHDHGAHLAGMDHGDMDHAMMHDTPVDVPAADAPQVSLMVMPDPMAGYNLHVVAENFTFSPERASLANVAGEGHAHVYINGEKLGRLYNPWMHIDGLPKGEIEVKVTLNTNDHRPLAVNGTPVSATQMITVE
jgi:hypothetical protein